MQSDFHVHQEPPAHPHGGARDEHGTLGYVHDPTYLRSAALRRSSSNNSTLTCRQGPGLGAEGSLEAYDALKKIVVSPAMSKKKLFCMVYTHSNQHEFLQAIRETWGPKCDGFMAASNVTDLHLGAVHLTHEGPEEYRNMWQKVRSMWAYAHDHYRNDYDYFHIGGDDMFVIPENLKSYIETLNDTNPIYMGGPIANLMSRPRRSYCGGGSGYTLNRAALSLLVKELLPTCRHNVTSPGEDYSMALCFLEKDIKCQDTSDPAFRYHAQDAHYQATWSFDKSKHNIMQSNLKKFHGMDPQDGIDGVSVNSISFHLKQLRPEKSSLTLDRMRRYYDIIYGSC